MNDLTSYIRKIHLLLPLIFQLHSLLLAQEDPFKITQYPYIKYDKNEIYDPTGRFSDTLVNCLIRVINGNEKFTIAHIGDSHIQADFFTGSVRSQLQILHPGISGARGLIFPYQLAETNNPANYSIISPNKWQATTSTKTKEPSNIGIFGLKITTQDSAIELTIKVTDTLSDFFDRVTLYYGSSSCGNVTMSVNGVTAGDTVTATPNGKATALLGVETQSVTIKIELNTSGYFDLFGINLANSLTGLTYHAIGVNGASAASFNRSLLFTQQLRWLNPNLIILSLGTNDSYNSSFTADWFREQYSILLDSITQACPNSPLLVSTPNDHSLRGIDMSAKKDTLNNIIKELADQRGLAFWDFFDIMGGDTSINTWSIDNLSARDKVHLSPKGYRLKAQLFYIAILKTFDHKISHNTKEK